MSITTTMTSVRIRASSLPRMSVISAQGGCTRSHETSSRLIILGVCSRLHPSAASQPKKWRNFPQNLNTRQRHTRGRVTQRRHTRLGHSRSTDSGTPPSESYFLPGRNCDTCARQGRVRLWFVVVAFFFTVPFTPVLDETSSAAPSTCLTKIQCAGVWRAAPFRPCTGMVWRTTCAGGATADGIDGIRCFWQRSRPRNS